MKLIVLVIGVALGFGVGVYWGVHHPTEAANLSDQEERKFIQFKIETTQAIKQKLDQIANKQTAQPGKGFGAGFVSGNSAATGPDPDVVALRNDQDRELQNLQQQLQKLNK